MDPTKSSNPTIPMTLVQARQYQASMMAMDSLLYSDIPRPPPGLSQREVLLFHLNDVLEMLDDESEDELFGESSSSSTAPSTSSSSRNQDNAKSQ